MSKPKNKPKNIYDRIWKENIPQFVIPLVKRHLQLTLVHSEALDSNLQSTIQREADFLRIVETDKGERFILHLEFQVENDSEMIYRIKEYDALLQRIHKMPVRSCVVFLGQRRMTMQTQLATNEVFSKFEVINIQELDFNQMLQSQIPEEIILAILCDYKNHQAEQLIRTIIDRLKTFSQNPNEFKKFILQLAFLSNLRNLGEETFKIAEHMAISFNVEDSFFYKKGRAAQKAINEEVIARIKAEKEAEKEAAIAKISAEKEAEKEAEKKAAIAKISAEKEAEKEAEKKAAIAKISAEKEAEKEATTQAIVINMLLSKMLTDQQIADFLNLSIQYVQDIKDSIE